MFREFSRLMKSNQGEFQQFLFAFLVLFLHRIPVFGNAHEFPCNRTCGSRTVKYPFGFSGACPYMLDSDCSECGNVYLKGFQVLNFTNSSIIIRPWQSKNSKLKCFDQDADSLSIFKPQFGLTNRNLLLLTGNCSDDCINFNITDLRTIGSQYYDGRENCSTNSSVSIKYLMSKTSKWISWKSLEISMCKYFLTSLISDEGANNDSVSFDVDKVELGWWVNGTCLPNSCSAQAKCFQFQKPNKSNETVHRCYCKQGFEGDGFSEGFGCRKVGGVGFSDGFACLNGSSITMSRRRLNISRVVLPIGLFIVGSAMVVGFIFLYCCYQRYRRTLKTRRSLQRLISVQGGPLNIPLYTYREMEIATKGFSSELRLGTGGFGTVYAGKLPGKGTVAVKKIKHKDTQGMEQVLNEIRLLSTVYHPNLVRLLGCCLENGEPILVYEFMPNGTLYQHLHKERGKGLSWRSRVSVAAETARALSYLHSALNPPIYHRDVKSSNILVDHGFKAKVADFGLCRIVQTEASHISTAPQGTFGYLDPLYYENYHLTDKSDVYSFGVVLVEIITALKVVDFSRKKSEVNLAFLAITKIGGGCLHEIIDPFLQADKDAEVRAAVHRVAELAFRCLSFDRDCRPTMVEVAQELEFIAYNKSGLESTDSISTIFHDSNSTSFHTSSGTDVQLHSWSTGQSSR